MYFGLLCQKSLGGSCVIFFVWVFSSVPLVFLSVFIAMELYYRLRSVIVISPALDFLLRISLAICDLWEWFLYLCEVCPWNFYRAWIEYVDWHWTCRWLSSTAIITILILLIHKCGRYFNLVKLMEFLIRCWSIFWCLFNFFHQWITAFIEKVFYHNNRIGLWAHNKSESTQGRGEDR
jgi:hypothetical protein